MWKFILSHLVVPLFYYLTFDGSILTLCSSNITFDSTFVIFGGSLFFSSHLTVLSSHCAIPTSYLIVLLSFYFFSHIWQFHCQIRQYQHHIWQYFVTFDSSFIFVLTFDGSIDTLGSANIISDSTFVTFSGRSEERR